MRKITEAGSIDIEKSAKLLPGERRGWVSLLSGTLRKMATSSRSLAKIYIF